MICIHGLTLPQRGNSGRYFGTIRAMPAILLRWYYFWNFSLGCPAVPIWERLMENLEIKKIGKTFFPKLFSGLFTLVIWLFNVYIGCLLTFFFFFRMPLNPTRQTCIPRPYIFNMPLLSFYRTSFDRLCSVRSESHIKHLFVAWMQKKTKFVSFCLLTKCGFYHVIWKFPVIFQNSRFSTSIFIWKTHLLGKVCTELYKLIHLRHVLSENISPFISTFSIKPNITMFPDRTVRRVCGGPAVRSHMETKFLNDFSRVINKVILLMYLVDEIAYSLNFKMAVLEL